MIHVYEYSSVVRLITSCNLPVLKNIVQISKDFKIDNEHLIGYQPWRKVLCKELCASPNILGVDMGMFYKHGVIIPPL